jgi:hypothetical protein
LWGDYVAARGLGPVWQSYVQECRMSRSVAVSNNEQGLKYQQPQQQLVYHQYTNPGYTGAIAPVSGAINNSSNCCCLII